MTSLFVGIVFAYGVSPLVAGRQVGIWAVGWLGGWGVNWLVGWQEKSCLGYIPETWRYTWWGHWLGCFVYSVMVRLWFDL